MIIKRFKLHSIDQGNCRIYYTTRNSTGQKLLYCLMENHGIGLYRCSQDGEPDYEIPTPDATKHHFDIPTGDSQLENDVKTWVSQERGEE